jgi:hypothetical protein
MNMSDQQEKEFREANNCHVCGKELNEDRARDHDHLTGQYRVQLTMIVTLILI